MKIIVKAHLEAASDLIEVASLAGWFSICVDIIWCICDFVHTPGHLYLLFVMGGLSSSFLLMSLGIFKYHYKNTKTITKRIMTERLKICKRMIKRKVK